MGSAITYPMLLQKLVVLKRPDHGGKMQNRWSERALWVAVLVSVAATCARAQETVSMETGKLQGSSEAGVSSFKGIPYAAPPVGDLRWEPPQPPAAWSGIRLATDFGHDCMQMPTRSEAAPRRTIASEDCLYLNIWLPEHRSGKLPVMVWIHGGGWVQGGTSPNIYDGAAFARQGIVFVSLNYRLGRFGFFAFPELTKESKSGQLGNYGYFDQLAALKWVQRNIAAFGGDPQQVTIAGESAGGGSVHAMMTSPLTAGLFSRAIVQSGGGRSLLSTTTLREGRNGMPSAEQIGVAFAASKGIKGDGPEALKQLRALPADAVVDGLSMATLFTAGSTYSGPIIDGTLTVNEPQFLYAAGKYQHVPLIVGANSVDMGMSRATTVQQVFAHFGAKEKDAEAAYDASASKDVHALGVVVASDAMMAEPARFVVQTLSAQHVPVWEFRFSYVAESMRSQWAGAPHATDVPFVFDTARAHYGAPLTEADEKVAQEINTYWANFIKTGNPNGAGLPDWPAYQSSSDMLMDFTSDGPVSKPDPWKKRLDLTEELASQQAGR
jgi:para-nitrobenzyl esterase